MHRSPWRISPWIRVRHALRRHRSIYWLSAVCLVVATAASVSQLTTEADRTRDRFGALADVHVARVDIAAGVLVESSMLDVASLPVALLPTSPAVDPVGRRASAAIVAGEVVVTERLAPAGSSVVAARLPPHTRGMALPVGAGALPAEPGDRVDLIASYDPSLRPGHATSTLVTGGVVVATDEGVITVAVPVARVETTTDALVNGRVTVVLATPDYAQP